MRHLQLEGSSEQSQRPVDHCPSGTWFGAGAGAGTGTGTADLEVGALMELFGYIAATNTNVDNE